MRDFRASRLQVIESYVRYFFRYELAEIVAGIGTILFMFVLFPLILMIIGGF